MRDKINSAYTLYRDAYEKYKRVCLESFPVGTKVTWVVYRSNGEYVQYGTVVDVRPWAIFVMNNRTQKQVRFDMDAIFYRDLEAQEVDDEQAA